MGKGPSATFFITWHQGDSFRALSIPLPKLEHSTKGSIPFSVGL